MDMDSAEIEEILGDQDYSVGIGLPEYLIPAQLEDGKYKALLDTFPVELINGMRLRTIEGLLVVDLYSFVANYTGDKPSKNSGPSSWEFPFYPPKPLHRVALTRSTARDLALQLNKALEAMEKVERAAEEK